MQIEQISNWNEKISSKELEALKKIVDNPKEILKNFDKKSLIKLRQLLISQEEKYLKRPNVKKKSKIYIQHLTKNAISKLNKILENKSNNIESLDKEFPNIKLIKGLEPLINQKISTENDIKKWKNITIKEPLYSIKKAQEYSIDSAKEWIKKSKDKKYINYKAISEYAEHSKQTTTENLKLKNLIAASQIFMWATETWNDPLSKKLQSEMKKFGLDIKNNPNDRWCAAFVWRCLIKAGFYKDIKDLKKHLPYPYPDVASNYLWLWYFPAHIGIYTWGETMINWNSHNMVRYSKVNFKKLVWWVMPEDIGKSDKVHFYQKEKIEPPVGAILVFKRGNKKLPEKIARISGFDRYS